MKEVEKLLDDIDVNCPECDNPCKTMVHEVEACKTKKYKQLIIDMIKTVDEGLRIGENEYIDLSELKTKLIDIIKRKV
jgi:hypothetical protein